MINIDYEHCTACGACLQICPNRCITWKKKEFGFQYPDINTTKCIRCNLCSQVCPIHENKTNITEINAYAVVNKDLEILNQSTSGGMFTALAVYVLKQGGWVFGCIMDEALQVQHVGIQQLSELNEMRSSKYVQSNTKNTYQETQKILEKGQLVLYSGTPCQIAGLKGFLQKEYANLITVDIVCHGVGAQDYFNKFLGYLKHKYENLKSLQFRDKRYVGWSCGGGGTYFDSKTSSYRSFPFLSYQNYYYQYFLSGDIYRKSCYTCPYASLDRQGDMTLGDFWGVERLKLDLDTYNGCSVVLVNTEKGRNVFNQLSGISKVKVSVEDAVKHNQQLSTPSKFTPSVRDRLIQQYETMNGDEIQEAYLHDNKKKIFKGMLKTCIPYSVKLKLRKLLQ